MNLTDNLRRHSDLVQLLAVSIRLIEDNVSEAAMSTMEAAEMIAGNLDYDDVRQALGNARGGYSMMGGRNAENALELLQGCVSELRSN